MQNQLREFLDNCSWVESMMYKGMLSYLNDYLPEYPQ